MPAAPGALAACPGSVGASPRCGRYSLADYQENAPALAARALYRQKSRNLVGASSE